MNIVLTVGIIMRTKNRNVLLRRAVESVIHQSYQNWSLVIINDGGDSAKVEQLLSKYSKETAGRVTIHHNTCSVGMEAASNMGLALIEAEMAIIHDDDDTWAPEFLARMLSVYLKERITTPTIRGIICHCHRVDETLVGNIINVSKLEHYNQNLIPGILPTWEMIKHNQMPPICFLFDLSTCRKLNCFDPTLVVLGDWDFNLRFMMLHDIWVLPESLAFYHHRPGISGPLGNSLHDGIERHRTYRKLLENRWFREDMQSGTFGLGSLIVMSHLNNGY